MKSITFETATIADALTKAKKIAPTKGTAFDKVAGIVIEAEGAKSGAIVRCTNVDVTYREVVNTLEVGEEDVAWRLPSDTISDIISRLPIGTGNTVTMTEDQETGWVRITSGRRRAKMARMPMTTYPRWTPFDASELVTVPDFAGRVKQVTWAAEKKTPPLSGLHITGDEFIATDKYRVSRAPCVVPVEKPITVPMQTLTPLLDSAMDVQLKAEERRLLIALDDYTQITMTIFAVEYPPVERIDGFTPSEFDMEVRLDRNDFVETLQQVTALIKSDRFPDLELTFKDDVLQLYLEAGGVGAEKTSEMSDEIDIDFTDESHTFNIDPSFLRDALQPSTSPHFYMRFNRDPFKVIQIDPEDGYKAWLMPRRSKRAGHTPTPDKDS